MNYMTVKIKYGEKEKFTNSNDLINHLLSIGAVITSHNDVFEQYEELKKEIKRKKITKLVEKYIEIQ